MDTIRPSEVTLPNGVRLALRSAGTGGRTVLLVHGLASNARLWDGVALRLAAAGHTAIAVDQRGHGLSSVPDGGYDTDTCADDLASLVATLGVERPIVAGQSWGGNVVLSLAARHPGAVGAVCCVDGGWLHLRPRFATFDAAWEVLEPPRMDTWRWDDISARIHTAMADWPDDAASGALANLVRLPDGGVRARLDRAHHRSIVASLYDADPASWYPLIDVPVLLCPATGETPEAGESGQPAATRAAVRAALAALPDGRVHWYDGAHHDLHAQHPDLLARDLLDLAEVAR